MLDALARVFAAPLDWFYGLVHNYGLAIILMTIVIMAILTPLTLKSTKGMLEMQLLQPELKKLQAQHRGDRQKLNEEMMKLYQEHKVNPLASCLPMLAQLPVFMGMYRLLRGLTQFKDKATDAAAGTEIGTFAPKFLKHSSVLYKDLTKSKEMLFLGLDLAKKPIEVMQSSLGKGLIYAMLIAVLGLLYWVQQRMISNRMVNPTMSAGQAKLMQYLPVLFAPFQLFFPTGLVIYYLSQTVLRIAQQGYITQRFYRGDNSLGSRASDASSVARELGKSEKGDKSERSSFKDLRDQIVNKPAPKAKPAPSRPTPTVRPTPSRPKPTTPNAKSVTPPKGAPTPPEPRANRPGSTGPQKQAGGSRHPKPKK